MKAKKPDYKAHSDIKMFDMKHKGLWHTKCKGGSVHINSVVIIKNISAFNQ